MTNSVKLPKIVLINELIKDPARKPFFKMLSELIVLSIVHKEFPRHYFSRFLFKKEITNVKHYCSDGMLKKIKPNFNNKDDINFLENKLYFDFYYNQFKIEIPKILMYNHKKLFVINGRSFNIDNVEDFKIELKKIFEQNSDTDSMIIKKTYGSWGGASIYKLFHKEIESNNNKILQIYEEVIKTGFLFQKTIKQHATLDKLNSSCLNTLRLDTFMDKDGNVSIISGYIRMSYSNHYVDNITSGGCYVGVNIQNGKLEKYGYRAITNYGVNLLTEHPVTQIVFKDFEIPFFEKAKELVIAAAVLMPGVRLIGWDVAISEVGPIIVEGNSDYDMKSNDLVAGGYLNDKTFKKILHELNYA